MQAETTWQRNAGSQIVLDSIFAALAAIWVTFAIDDRDISNVLKFFEVACSLLSFFYFAISAEGTTSACDENDVVKFVYYLLWYNVGVILIGIAIGILVLSHFDPHFVRRVGAIFWYVPPAIIAGSIHIGYAGLWLVLLWRWIVDSWFILCVSPEEFRSYIRELSDEAPPEFNRHWLMCRIFKRRLRDEKAPT